MPASVWATLAFAVIIETCAHSPSSRQSCHANAIAAAERVKKAEAECLAADLTLRRARQLAALGEGSAIVRNAEDEQRVARAELDRAKQGAARTQTKAACR